MALVVGYITRRNTGERLMMPCSFSRFIALSFVIYGQRLLPSRHTRRRGSSTTACRIGCCFGGVFADRVSPRITNCSDDCRARHRHLHRHSSSSSSSTQGYQRESSQLRFINCPWHTAAVVVVVGAAYIKIRVVVVRAANSTSRQDAMPRHNGKLIDSCSPQSHAFVHEINHINPAFLCPCRMYQTQTVTCYDRRVHQTLFSLYDWLMHVCLVGCMAQW